MASKKAGRAAGLAALAGLAYMAREKGMFGGKDKGDKSAPDRDDADRYMGSRAPVKSSSGDFMSEKEPGWDTKTGSGDLMSEKEPGWDTKSSPASVARTTPTAKAPATSGGGSGPISGAAFNNSAKAPSGGGSSGPLSGAAFNNSAKAPSGGSGPISGAAFNNIKKSPAVEAQGGNRSVRSNMPRSGLGDVRRPGTNVNYENEETSDMGMKRGGKVKKMASGGMTSSASSRGDGIASKGKTRCKMY